MIKVMIADDQRLLVDLLAYGLNQCDDFDVVESACNGEEAIRLAMENRPDVILMDITMPECDGIEATRKIKKLDKSIKILVLTNSGDEQDVQEALSVGADGYVLKSIQREDLILAIRSIHANMKVVHQEGWYSKNQAGGSIHSGRLKDRVVIDGEEVTLTQRELTLLAMVVEGKSFPEMAEKMEISEGRARNLITSLIKKLQVQDRTQLAVFALRNHLVKK